MSVTGKGSLSIRKQDVREQKNLGVGFKKIQFAHKATLGSSTINLLSLTVPTEMSGVGFTNPSSAELSAAQLSFYRKNFTLVSSLRGVLMDYVSYNVSTDTNINLVGFTAADGEIFVGTVDYNARNGQNLVDAAPLVSTGTLAISSTDYNVGQLFQVGQYITQQVGAVVVYRNGLQQFRNTNNSSVTLDGNYYEVNNGSGTGQIIRFNTVNTLAADSILVVSNGLLAYNPDGSALQQIQALAGKIDVMIPTLADLAGVPQTNFQAAPSSVDLKSFGDTVLSQGTRITALEAGPSIVTLTSANNGSSPWSVPAGAKWLKVKMIGQGGGGAGSGSAGGNVGSEGASTTFGPLTAKGGGGGVSGSSGSVTAANTVGGGLTAIINSNGTLGLAPQGDSNATSQFIQGGDGGAFMFGGAARGGINVATSSPAANTGAGGSGGGWWNTTGIAGGGGSSGGYLEVVIPNSLLASSYAFAVGTGLGGGGAPGAGASAFAGSAGATGLIVIEVYY